jgi:hypothetical protein
MAQPWKCLNPSCGAVNVTPLKPLPHCERCGLLIGTRPQPEPDLTDAERREVEER